MNPVIQMNNSSYVKPHWTPTQQANAELVVNFIHKLMNEHDFEYITRTFGPHPYKQHNQAMKDGIAGVVAYLSKFVKSFPEFSYDIKNVLVDGDLVSVHSHATLKGKHRGNDSKGLNIIDTWRIEDGRLVEHWDAVQPIDLSMRAFSLFAGGKKLNQNGFF